MNALSAACVLLLSSAALAEAPPSRAGEPPGPRRLARLETARALFQRPVIRGASVSRDFAAPSPGRLIARALGTEGALGGPLESASVLVGVDAFFWSSTESDCAVPLSRVQALFAQTRALRLPVIVGNVPPLRASGDCREATNAAIALACAEGPDCYLVDLDGLYREAAGEGAEFNGRRYGLRDGFADGLHPNELGSRIIAQRILDAIAARAR